MSDSSRPRGLQPIRLLCPMGFSRQEYWSGLSFPPPGDLPYSGIKSASLVSPGLVNRFYTTEPYEKPSPLVQFRSVAQFCPTLCDPMNCSTPGLSITNSRSLPKLMSVESVIPSNHVILGCPLLLLTSIFPRIKVFSNESARRIRWAKYWSFSYNMRPFNEHPGLISFRMD